MWYVLAMNQKKGFNLLELIAVLMIVGILAALGLPQFRAARNTALDKEAISNLKLIQAAEKIYKVETSSFYNCGSTALVNAQLLLGITDSNWNYDVSGAPASFTATATKVGDATTKWCVGPNGEPTQAGCP
jgi:prepilin-type N-terminal cleavage/methylation domain-containing protein